MENIFKNFIDRLPLRGRFESLTGLSSGQNGPGLTTLRNSLESGLSMGKTQVGVDIGADSIKCVRIQKKGDSNKLLSFHIVPVSHLRGKPYEEKSAEIAEILSSLLKEGESSRAFMDILKSGDNAPVFTAVSGSDVVIKNFSIARLSGAKMKNAVFWASKKYVPFPMEDAYFDFKVTGDAEEREAKKKEVMVVAASKQLIHKMLGLFEKSELNIPGITATPFALSNILRITETGASIALIDIGAENTSIAIFQDNTLKFAREIVTSGNSITESIAAQASIPFEEAEGLKKECGLSKKKGPQACIEGIMPVVDRLINEIQRSFSFYKEKHPDFTIERIYLTGGTATMAGLSQMMQERLSTDVEVIHSFDKLDLSSVSVDVEEFTKSAPLFTKAISLALETDEGIDLLPPKARHQKAMNRLTPAFRLSAIFMILLCIILYAEISARVYIKTKSLNQLKSNMQRQHHLALNPGRIQVNSSRYKLIKETLDVLEKREIIDPFILKEMTNVTPESIVLEGLAVYAPESSHNEKGVFEDGQMQLQGMVYGKGMDMEMDLLQFLVTLDSSPFFEKPVLVEKKKEVLAGEDILRFTIRCHME